MPSQTALRQAEFLHRQGRLGDAERFYQAAIAVHPRDFTAHYQLAFLLYQQQRCAAALGAVEAALKLKPTSKEALLLHSVLLLSAREFERALVSISAVTDSAAGEAEAWHTRGVILLGLRRYDEALINFDKALAINPVSATTWCQRGNVLIDLGRASEALVAFDQALSSSPDLFDAWNNRGLALYNLDRFADSVASYDAAAAIQPRNESVWTNRGKALERLERFEDALASFDTALSLAPKRADIWFARALTLRMLNRIDEALADVHRALAINDAEPNLQMLRGWLLCELNRITDGFEIISKYAHAASDGPPPSHKERHDVEQRAYTDLHGAADGTKLRGPTISASTRATAAAQWTQNRPRIAVIDNFLTAPALEKLQRFCLASPIWHAPYDDGYLGAMPEQGFACPFLAQVAEELRDGLPEIIGGHRLRMMWAFKYDSRMRGIGLHADQAAVNVNFWITPDEANLDPTTGGMVIWDVAAPTTWDVRRYNGDPAAVRAFLKDSGAKPLKVPYRANRAVIFDSDLFHETDTIAFKDGYLNRRINVTMLYGRRTRTGL